MTPDALVDLLGIPFTPAQLTAACPPLPPGPVLAGPGSRPPSLMSARVVRLVGGHRNPGTAR